MYIFSGLEVCLHSSGAACVNILMEQRLFIFSWGVLIL